MFITCNSKTNNVMLFFPTQVMYVLCYFLVYISLNFSALNECIKRILFAFDWNRGRFIIFSVITDIYNKKTKGPTLMDLFRATGNQTVFWTTRDVRCVQTLNISSCQNNFFSFPVAVNNSIKVGSLVFLL
jgi:hypothetical protein